MKSFIALLGFAASAAADLVSTGASLKLGDVYYYVSPYSQGKADASSLDVASLPKAFGFTPVTVVADGVEEAALESLFSNWTSKDDVWQPAFLSAVFLAGHDEPCPTKGYYHDNVTSLVAPLDGSSVPSGPYFLETATGELHQAFRLYTDFAGAFSESLLQSPEETFQPLSAQIPASASLTIGVPSRLYYTPTKAKPLAGVRIGVKDIYDLAGAKKSNGNRAYWSLYPPAEHTAPSIQNLVDAGGIVVGYQKTSQFANGESPTADWVDYHAPFNPRGDGYNNPSSSSSGAGASVAAYPWLDIAVGSDTGGSVRGPAGAQGLFGNRPSTGLVSLDDVMPLSPTLDTPGFLVRDPGLWDAANQAMYGENYTSLQGRGPVEYPTTIYTIGFPEDGEDDDDATSLLTGFADSLAEFFGGELTPLNLTEAWQETGPVNITLDEMLNLTYATLITKEQIELVREPFYEDYAAENDGRLPFVNPVPLSRWAWGDSIPDEWYPEAVENKTIFMDWFNSEVLPQVASANDLSTTACTSALILYPGSAGNPSPRNQYSASPPGVPFGFSTGRVSVYSEAPDNVYPLGEVRRESSITGQEEYLPVAVNVLAAKGCDGVLVRLALDLVDEGLLEVPLAGGTMDGADILMRRELLAEMEGWYSY